MQGKRHIAPLEAFPFEYLSGDYKNLNIPDLELFIADVAVKKQAFFCIWLQMIHTLLGQEAIGRF